MQSRQAGLNEMRSLLDHGEACRRANGSGIFTFIREDIEAVFRISASEAEQFLHDIFSVEGEAILYPIWLAERDLPQGCEVAIVTTRELGYMQGATLRLWGVTTLKDEMSRENAPMSRSLWRGRMDHGTEGDVVSQISEVMKQEFFYTEEDIGAKILKLEVEFVNGFEYSTEPDQGTRLRSGKIVDYMT